MPPIHIVLKIKRAEEHIDNLNSLILAFKSTNPYEITGYSNPEAGEAVYKISKAAEIPLGISLIVGDVLQNLRTSLDYLAGELVRASGSVPDSNTAFPISSSATDYETEKRRKVKGMRQDIIDAIDAVKPYKGGNDTLWRLHELNRIDKHRLLLTVGSSFVRFDTARHTKWIYENVIAPGEKLTWPAGFSGSRMINPGSRSFPLKIGHVLLVDTSTSKVNEEMDFGIDVAFGESGIVEGESVLETVQGMFDVVRNLGGTFGPLVL